MSLLVFAAVLPASPQELYENKKIDYRFDNLLAEAYRDAMREVESEESSASSSSGTGSSSGGGVCPKCGGKGYLPEAYEYAAGSRYAPYHNSGGTQCPICGKSTDHYHYRCLECKRG